MKNKRQDFILIKGGSSPNPQGSTAPFWADQAGTPSNASLTLRAHTAAVDGLAQAPWAALRSEATPPIDPAFVGPSLEGLRDFDSLRLTGHAGVVQVGVNDLGWVVYDWFPGP